MADTSEGKSYALLIGVNDYAHLRDLHFAGNDMRVLRDAFVTAGFDSSNVMLLHDDAERSSLRPLRSNIIDHLRTFLLSVNKNDTVVVAFSGHGVNIKGKDYFCGADAKLENPEDTMVRISVVDQMLKVSRARQKVLIMDACRNDPYQPNKKSVRLLGSFYAKSAANSGYVVLRSCESQQESVEDPELRHGVFMNFVINGLLGHADANRDKKVDLLELYNYAEYETKTHVRARYAMDQTPTLELPGGELVGSYVLSRVASRPQKLDVQKVSHVAAGALQPSTFELKLYDSAYNLFQRGKVNDSIVAFEQLLAVAEHEQVRDITKMKLVSAYLTADPVNNIPKALKVQGNEGVTVTVLRDSKLMSGKEKRGSVKPGQMVRITQVKNGWHRVEAINGRVLGDGKEGFVYKTALTPAPKTSSSKPSSSSSRPSNRPSNVNSGYGYANFSRPSTKGQYIPGGGAGIGAYRDFDHRDRGLAREAGRLYNEADRAERWGKPVVAELKRRAADNRANQIRNRERIRSNIRANLFGGRR